MTVQTGPNDFDPWLNTQTMGFWGGGGSSGNVATIYRAGLVQPDGVTIIVTPAGVISATGVGSGNSAGGFLVGQGPPAAILGSPLSVYLDTQSPSNNFWIKNNTVWSLLGTLSFANLTGGGTGGGTGNGIPYLQAENGNPITTEAGDDFTF